MRPYPRFGGESVSFATTSLALHILYYLYLLLSPLWLLYGSSGLLRKLAHQFRFRRLVRQDNRGSHKKRENAIGPPVGPFGYIVTCHHLALPFNILCSPVQALPALIRFASQTCAPILLSQTGPLGQQGEPQKKERTLVLSFFCVLVVQKSCHFLNKS